MQTRYGQISRRRTFGFNPWDNFEYFLSKLEQSISHSEIDWKSNHNEINSLTAAEDILSCFKQWIEYNKGWEVVQGANSRKREKILQRVIHLSGISYINANNLDMSCEPDEGRGPVDFKISRGQDITIVEVNLRLMISIFMDLKYRSKNMESRTDR